MAVRKSLLNGNAPKMADTAASGAVPVERVTITAPRIQIISVPIRGTAPLVINSMSARVVQHLAEIQRLGSVAKNKKNREPKDFDACFEQAKHTSTKGWCGIHAAAFRCAMIDVCRTVNYKMTMAKMSIFVLPDGYSINGTPLVKITKGEPIMSIAAVKLPSSGVADVRPRPMWETGWEAVVRVSVDMDQFSPSDVINLMARAGFHCGVGEGRPFSKDSNGCGWGTFEVITESGLSVEG